MIPTEIVDHILGFLCTDHATLKTCSTVFPQIVDRHLYSHITLRTPMMEDDTDEEDIYHVVEFNDFIDQLVARPQIILCVLGVRIVIAVMPGRDDVTFECLPMISSMLAVFRKIKSIELTVWGTFSWHALDSDFCSAFQNCLRFPSISKVAISGINGFPLDSFDGCKNLRNLVLCGQFMDSKKVSTSPYPRLSSLRIESRHRDESQPASELTTTVAWMETHTLQTLSLCMLQSLDLPKFQPLIGACSATLVTLELDLSECVLNMHPDTLTGTVFGNPQLPALKHFILRSSVVSLSLEDHVSSLPYLAPFLIALSRTSSPDSVHLSVHLRFHVMSLFVRDNSLDIKWPDITLIDGLPVFRHPIELHIGPCTALGRIGPFFEQSSDIQRLLVDRRLVVIEEGE